MRYKYAYKSLVGLGMAMGLLSQVALATSSYYDKLNTQCATLNGTGSVRNSSVGCTTCHDSSYNVNSTGRAFISAGHKPTAAISSILCTLAAATNTAPTANAGPDQSITNALPVTVTLKGTGADKDGDALTFTWSLTKKPAGSQAVLSSTTAASPSFSADVVGQYTAKLIVNDGKLNSSADTVSIIVGKTGNAKPVAHAGLDQHVQIGALVTLSASGTDADNEPLTYLWTLKTPKNSAAVLSNATALMPTFIADLPGRYEARLVVNDGKVNSNADSVMITAGSGNVAPVANAGADKNALLNTEITLNGKGFDADGDSLTYLWSLIKIPKDSSAHMSDATLASPILVADKLGEYVAQLIVNDGVLNSKPDTVLIKVSEPVTSEVSVGLALMLEPSVLMLEEFGKSIIVKANISAVNNVDRLDIPVLVSAKVGRPDGSSQSLGQKRILLKEVYKIYAQYTPKMVGEHTVTVVISDQTGGTLAEQSKKLTVLLQNDDDDDEHDSDGHDDDD
ncbi:PKD domain-containing protein [Methylocucumis oryzae]|nr:PKD domain-containing protein [Methylocucumis oryzae]